MGYVKMQVHTIFDIPMGNIIIKVVNRSSGGRLEEQARILPGAIRFLSFIES